MRRIIVNEEHCIACGICATVCPQGIIEVHSLPLIGDTSKCLENCKICEENCPTIALEIFDEE